MIITWDKDIIKKIFISSMMTPTFEIWLIDLDF